MEELLLTHKGEKVAELGKDNSGAVDDQERFTRSQIVDALRARAVLFAQTGGPDTDGKTVTSEIEILLRTSELVKTEEGRKFLYVEKTAEM
ncbi:hypothetical protein M0P48_00470 [Candidatus Gracilibacteria bacterium]|jgi:hypothetical protein|nr:hypothetical protein [Candidatus Gracilibacteria bacterium]